MHPFNSIAAMAKALGFIALVGSVAAVTWCAHRAHRAVRRIAQ